MAPPTAPTLHLAESAVMTPLDPDTILRRFANGTLSHAAWTHEAHLTVCWYAVTMMGPDGALVYLRDAIRRLNDTMNVANTDHSGYHETLTWFYVGAVAHAAAPSPRHAAVLPSCTRDAPFRHWTRAVLFSPAARHAVVPPDLAPLPWSSPG